MPLLFNGTTVTDVNFIQNGITTNLNTVNYNGVQVFSKAAPVIKSITISFNGWAGQTALWQFDDDTPLLLNATAPYNSCKINVSQIINQPRTTQGIYWYSSGTTSPTGAVLASGTITNDETSQTVSFSNVYNIQYAAHFGSPAIGTTPTYTLTFTQTGSNIVSIYYNNG